MEKNVTIALDGLSVMVGMPAGRDLHPLTVKSLLATFLRCQAMSLPCELGMIAQNAVVTWARDEVVDLFLRSKANRLFWIDSDMVWEPEHFLRLLAFSQSRDVVCATYPAKMEPTTFYVNRDQTKPLVPDEYGLLEIWGVGLGFTVMQRAVVEALVERAPKHLDEITAREMSEVFRLGSTINVDGKRSRCGEDMGFFGDIRGLGYKVWLDPSVGLGHIGTKLYTGDVRGGLPIQA